MATTGQLPPRLGALRPPRTNLSRDNARLRAFAYQGILVALVALIAWYLFSNTVQNLEERRIASGFGFLSREAGFEISETTLFDYSPLDTYMRALSVGLFNTFRVALIGIMLATALGTLIGLARLSRNWLLSQLASAYVELMRNVPLLVHLFLFYAVIAEILPGPHEALNPVDAVFLSNRGINYPVPRPHWVYTWLAVALLAGVMLAWAFARWARRLQARTGKPVPVLAGGAALVGGLPLAVYLAAGAPLELSRPVFGGFNFSGGGVLSPEFAALLIGLVVYTAAFIAEIVRAGVLAVDRGQVEAAQSLGLSQRKTMRLVILPQALRVIVPPMTSQYLNLTKNSSLAVAIGYPDLVSIANTTMNQTGQAVEGIAIIMLVYLTISLGISVFMNWYNRRIALRGA